MKKIILLVMLVFSLNAYSQSEINYESAKLSLFSGDLLDGELRSQYADLSQLKYVYNSKNELYTAEIKINIDNDIATSDAFWLMLILKENTAFYSWSILNGQGKGIVRSFVHSTSKNGERTFIQGQDCLSEMITKGKYTLTISVKEIPKTSDFMILRAGVNSYEYYNGIKHAVQMQGNITKVFNKF
ncbi:hypothetical protein J3D55_004276 [Chryseobacterium ginsenosidimutans]|uniref:hypothetical protein n=1 Tax=Chryseobacterium ginsenosidimutans TaxID=687846 RepID=UPI0021694C36|nr:hypothetical protein [Chryseobacterium ginsenosidimutans]MCS3871360.1 hypothetical protein [Chryseobacterium ginsenosidimutans]